MGHRELGGTRWGPGGGEAWARPGVAIGPLLPWGRAPGGPCAGRGGGEGNEPTRDSRTCGRITCLPPPGPAPRVRRGPLQGGSPGPQAELVTSRGGGQSAAAAAEGAEAAAAAAPLPARPWPSAASPRCSRTTPSRCGLSRERGGGARRRQRLGLVRSGPVPVSHRPRLLQDPAAVQPWPGPERAALDTYNPFESSAVRRAGGRRGRFPADGALPATSGALPCPSSSCSRCRRTRPRRRLCRPCQRPVCPRRRRPRSPRGKPAPRSPETMAPTARR